MSAKITEPPTITAREWNGFSVWWESNHEYLTGYGGPIESALGEPPALTTYVMPHVGKPIKLHFRFAHKKPNVQDHRVTVYLDGVPVHPLFIHAHNCRDVSLEHLYSGDGRETNAATFHVAPMEVGAGLDSLPDHVGEIRIEVHRGTIRHQRPAGRTILSVLPKHVTSPRRDHARELHNPQQPKPSEEADLPPEAASDWSEKRSFELDPADDDEPWITLILKYRTKDELIDKGLILAVKGGSPSLGELNGCDHPTAQAHQAVEARLSRIETALSNVCDQLGVDRADSESLSPEYKGPPRRPNVKLERFDDEDDHQLASIRTDSVVPIADPFNSNCAARQDRGAESNSNVIGSERQRSPVGLLLGRRRAELQQMGLLGLSL